MCHGRNAADIPLDQDLLLTFADDYKPSYGPYDGYDDGEDNVVDEAPTSETPAPLWVGMIRSFQIFNYFC